MAGIASPFDRQGNPEAALGNWKRRRRAYKGLDTKKRSQLLESTKTLVEKTKAETKAFYDLQRNNNDSALMDKFFANQLTEQEVIDVMRSEIL